MTSINSSTKTAKTSNAFRGMLWSILSSFIYGLSFIFTKSVSGEHTPFTILGWRFLIAFLAMEVLRRLGVFKIQLKGKDIWVLLRLVFLFPLIYFIGETYGVKLTTASESGIIIAIIPVVTMALSDFVLKERASKLQLTGIIISTIGIILIVLSQSLSASLNILGYLGLLAAVFSYSLYAVWLVRETTFSGLEKTYVMMMAAGICFFLMAMFERWAQGTLQSFLTLPFRDLSFIGSILYLALGSSVLAFFASNRAIVLLGPNGAASYAGLSTLITIVASVLVLKEPFGIWQMLAGILVLSGVYIANKPVKTTRSGS